MKFSLKATFPSLALLRSCLVLLDKRDRFLLIASALVQMSLVLLDLLGILLIGSIVAITTSAVQGRDLPSAIKKVIELLNLENFTPQGLATVFGVVAAIALFSKSFLTYYLNLRNLKFLAVREARISVRMGEMMLKQPITVLQKFGTPDYIHALTTGANSATVGILAGTIALGSEIFLQIIMATTLFVFSPALLTVFILYFGLLFLILHWMLGSKAKKWSSEIADLSVRSIRAISDAIGSYREIVVSGKRSYFIEKFAKSKVEISDFTVKNTMLGQFSKYVFENSVIIGGIIFAAYAFSTKTALEAASLMAIFVAASSRIAPSMLKIQLGLLLLKGANGATANFFTILRHLQTNEFVGHKEMSQISGKSTEINFQDVSFRYPGAKEDALKNITCSFEFNKTTAIVGPTGSGKSTLIDLMLGVLSPTQGSINIFGFSPEKVPESHIRVGYVPQRVYLTDGSLIENVCFGESPAEWDESKVWTVLDKVLLKDFVHGLPNGLSTSMGESGSNFSGGQRQRLGIARALYLNPDLLVLDEATSALDAISENEITKALERVEGELTTVVIAHRLSTVINADKIVYLGEGQIQGFGTFDELRVLIPDFDRQAELMGIRK